MHLHDRAIERIGLNLDPHDLFALQLFEYAI